MSTNPEPTVAWRGVVDDQGNVWAWPTILMDHETAFAVWPYLRKYRARWRQWSPGESISFDPGATPADKGLVSVWVAVANENGRAQ